MQAIHTGNATPPIRATLLGEVSICVGNQVIADQAWSLRSARNLLLLLLITPGHTLTKERVLDTLWPETDLDVSRNALYKALHLLRRVLEPDLTSGRHSAYIETQGGLIALRRDVSIRVDIDACETAIREAQASISTPERRRARLREAVAMYGGELLPTDLYEDWPTARRVAAHRSWEEAVLELARLDADAGQPGATLAPLEALLASDATLEAAHRALMRAYAETGQRGRALRQFERCEAALSRELGTEPDALTVSLFVAIQTARHQPEPTPTVDSGPFNNLPAANAPLVGRDREVEVVQGLLWRQDIRLVSLTGPGGVGKTRIALEAAAGLTEDFPDGVAYVSLAAVRDPALVIPAIATTLGAGEGSQQAPAAALTSWLQQREMLLVLDNIEQVVDAACDISDLLAACRSVTILVTGRERLQVRGEHVYEVPTLATPRVGSSADPAALERFGAVALFLQHMRQIDPTFEVTDDNAESVSQICRELDGLPLAIELAAARARFTTVQDLAQRLSTRLDLLQDGPRDLPARQRTLRATFAWSYDMLAYEEQLVFRRLAMCIGGCTTEAVAALAGRCGEPGVVQRHLHSLAEKHLVRVETHEGDTRWSMLETTREYAAEQLRAGTEGPEVRHAHAEHYLAIAVDAEQGLASDGQAAWLERLDRELGNIRSALHWSLQQPEAVGTLASRAAAALRLYWWQRGLVSEGTALLERAAKRTTTEPKLHATVLLAWAFLAEVQRDHARAEMLITEALPISRLSGDQSGVAKALTGLGEIAESRGDYGRATMLHREALDICRSANLRHGCLVSLNSLALLAYFQGDYRRATRQWTEAVAISRSMGNLGAVGTLVGNLGAVAMASAEFDRAIALHQEHQSIAYEQKDPAASGMALVNLAETLQLRGDGHQDDLLRQALDLNRQSGDRATEILTLTLMADSALAHDDTMVAAGRYTEALTICQETGERTVVASTALLERVANLALVTEQVGSAARLIGAGDSLRLALGAPMLPYLQPLRDRCMDQLRFKLRNARLTAATAEGGELTPDEALDDALALCSRVMIGTPDRHADAGIAATLDTARLSGDAAR